MAAANRLASSSSSSSSEGSLYDGFLSFYGEDIRTGFADCLYYTLVGAGIRTYRDEDELPKGDKIGPELLTAIQESIISIPIFSEHYSSSKWCLNELTQISECRRPKNRIVFPIFYKVEPRDVRNGKEIHAKASKEYQMRVDNYQKQLVEINAKVFEEQQKHFEETIVQGWKKALTEVGELNGWHLKERM
ncbi:disease resistance protein RPV1-like [Telopea speciosissima]|uniref:disease resistance protein RPV1-like n=1 Tax=Telopea speciosissima TaxID=54955 RepID=UPI001CC721AD|nr:disease resistance protein RPV1-like [Telopea speciosissima]